jgi:REase_AHJR-like
MNDQTLSRQAEVVEQLRRSYISRGYKFIVQPKGQDNPSFLGNVVPDAIAISSNDKVVLEVKMSTSSNSKSELVKYLAAEVPRHQGWRFELVIEDGQHSDRNADPTLEIIAEEISKVERLQKENDLKLSVVVGWATLEALSRRLVFDEENAAPNRYKPTSVVEALVSNGFVDDSDGARLLEISQLRNQLVHGFTQVAVEAVDVNFLVTTLKKLQEFACE